MIISVRTAFRLLGLTLCLTLYLGAGVWNDTHAQGDDSRNKRKKENKRKKAPFDPTKPDGPGPNAPVKIVPKGQPGQVWTVTGVVKDESGEPTPGIAVLVKDTTVGKETDENGAFTITVTGTKNVLVFRAIGYRMQEIAVAPNQTTLNVTMLVEETELSAVKVVGFASIEGNARRRLENIQTIPESVTAFSRQDLQDANAKTITDVIAQTPNVSILNAQNVGNITISVRGVSQVRNSDAPVTTVLDGVTLASPNSINQELYDVEQVEIVKGPQGALYGKNAIAGVLNIITRQPVDTFRHYVSGGYANGNTGRLTASSSGPIIKEKLRYALAATTTQSNGLIENPWLKTNVDYYKNVGGRLQLRYSPSEAFSADFKMAFSHTESGAVYYIPLVNRTQVAPDTVIATAKDSASNDYSGSPTSNRLGNNPRLLFDVSLKLGYMFSFAKLESITAYSRVDETYTGDFGFMGATDYLGAVLPTGGYVAAPFQFLQYQKLLVNALSEEIRLTSTHSEKIKWLGGLFFMYNNRGLTSAATLDRLFYAPGPDPANPPFFFADESNKNFTLAAFGQVNYRPIEKLEISGAIREDIDIRNQTNLVKDTVRSTSFAQFQPKLSISYKASKSVFVFATGGTGYRSGGFNPPSIATAIRPIYLPETTINFELGIKTNWWKNRLIANLSSFFIIYNNQQIFILDPSAVQVILNIDQSWCYGGELEVKARLARGFDILLGTGLTLTQIRKLPSSPELEGNRNPLIPVNNFTGTVQYKWLLGKGFSLTPRVQVTYRGRMYWTADNKDSQDPYVLVNPQLTFSYRKWSVTLWSQNLLNTQYNVEYGPRSQSGLPFDIRWPNRPRTFGVDFRVNF